MLTKLTSEFLEIDEQVTQFIKNQYKGVIRPRMIVETSDDGNKTAWFVDGLQFKPKPPCEYIIRPKIDKAATRKKVDELKKYFNQLKEKGEIVYHVSSGFGDGKVLKTIWRSEIDGKHYSFK